MASKPHRARKGALLPCALRRRTRDLVSPRRHSHLLRPHWHVGGSCALATPLPCTSSDTPSPPSLISACFCRARLWLEVAVASAPVGGPPVLPLSGALSDASNNPSRPGIAGPMRASAAVQEFFVYSLSISAAHRSGKKGERDTRVLEVRRTCAQLEPDHTSLHLPRDATSDF